MTYNNKRPTGEPPRTEALLREVAAAGVVHEAEPPGIDYVTVQIDMDTWAALREAAAAPPEPPRPDPDHVIDYGSAIAKCSCGNLHPVAAPEGLSLDVLRDLYEVVIELRAQGTATDPVGTDRVLARVRAALSPSSGESDHE